MNRRAVLKLLCKLGLFFTPFFSKLLEAMTQESPELSDLRLVLLYDSSTPSHSEVDRILEEAGPYLAEREPNWRKALVVLDVQSNASKARAFIAKYGANTEFFTWPILISVPNENDADPEVEIWTAHWANSRQGPSQPVCYPISGGWWSVDGDWNPTENKVRTHLFKSPNHTNGKFELPWLEILKLNELQSLHSDHHREMTGAGKVHWTVVNCCPM